MGMNGWVLNGTDRGRDRGGGAWLGLVLTNEQPQEVAIEPREGIEQYDDDVEADGGGVLG